MSLIVPTAFNTQTDTNSLKQLAQDSPETMEAEKLRLKKATREFEAFFLYQMMKTMRQTVPKDQSGESVLSGGMGEETFTQMFDMEIARKVSVGNIRSVADLLYKSLESLIDNKYKTPEINTDIRPLEREAVTPIPLEQPETAPVEHEEALPIPIERLEALLPVAQARREATPAWIRNVSEQWGDLVADTAREVGVDSALLASVIHAESSGDPKAVSPAGAKGLMQLTDATAQDLGVKDVFDPTENVRAGGRYLRKLIDRYGDTDLALAAYNAGPGNVDRYDGIPPFKETENYVTKVTDCVREFTHHNRTGVKNLSSQTDNTESRK